MTEQQQQAADALDAVWQIGYAAVEENKHTKLVRVILYSTDHRSSFGFDINQDGCAQSACGFGSPSFLRDALTALVASSVDHK